jgi:MraZ protein
MAGPPGSVGRWQPVFLGTHTPKLDDKGRLTLPAKFRDALAGGLMVTKGQDHCLYVFPRAEFEEMARKVAAPLTNEAVRAYQRDLFAGTDEQRPDGQGRIAVAPELRRYAGLTKDCVVIGAITRLEIWDAQAWQAYLDEHEDSYSQAREEVLPGFF